MGRVDEHTSSTPTAPTMCSCRRRRSGIRHGRARSDEPAPPSVVATPVAVRNTHRRWRQTQCACDPRALGEIPRPRRSGLRFRLADAAFERVHGMTWAATAQRTVRAHACRPRKSVAGTARRTVKKKRPHVSPPGGQRRRGCCRSGTSVALRGPEPATRSEVARHGDWDVTAVGPSKFHGDFAWHTMRPGQRAVLVVPCRCTSAGRCSWRVRRRLIAAARAVGSRARWRSRMSPRRLRWRGPPDPKCPGVCDVSNIAKRYPPPFN